MISSHGYHTSGVTSLFEHNFKVTLLHEDYFQKSNAYIYKTSCYKRSCIC